MMAPALNAVEIVGSAVATMVESRQVTREQIAIPTKTDTTFLNGNRFVWSVRVTSCLPESLSFEFGMTETSTASGSIYTEGAGSSTTSSWMPALSGWSKCSLMAKLEGMSRSEVTDMSVVLVWLLSSS